MTSTSLWMHYKNGVRNYCGNPLPEGLKKNAALEQPTVYPDDPAVLLRWRDRIGDLLDEGGS